ncbi:hypothetical protein PIB30_063303 [Stylosanthes scabra]|uniref:Uncharacterized protein n=1 Tax=Stylosanthes scabra TaxID=79078 RepID=A0ABU6ZK56_9FABA|nr:hypothetical protein [Stylosanthes scabra]
MVPRDQVDDPNDPLTCGIRLACLTWPKPNGLGRGEAFIHFLTLFINIDSDEDENYLTYPLTGKENVLPFVNSFTDPDPSIQAILDEYWSTILTSRLLPVGLPGEYNVALKRKVVSYSPQYVACQFGLAQALPTPILPDTDDQLVHYEVDDLGKLEQLLDRNHERMEEQFNRQSFPEIARQNSISDSRSTTGSREIYSFMVKEKEHSRLFEGSTFEQGFENWRVLAHTRHYPSSEAAATSPPEHAHSEPREQSLDLLLSQAKQVYSSGGKVPLSGGVGSKETAEPEAVGDVPPIPATLSKIAAKIIPLLGFPLEDLATDDKLKADLISAVNTLDDELPVSEADLIHQFGDFVSGLYSSNFLALADQKKELDAVVDGWKLLCRRAVDCSEATLQISQILEQGKKSEQEAVVQIEALEDELAVAKEGLANIRSANEDLSDKLKRYEGNKASLASVTFKAETDTGRVRASFNATEKKVEAFDQLCTRLKLSLGRFI